MKRSQIIDGNTLIAVFMGAKIGNGGTKRNPVYTSIKYALPNGRIVSTTDRMDDTRYHTSYDWIMPVVCKINSLKNGCQKINISPKWCGVSLGNQDFNMIYDSPVEQIWKACVKFIEQYNSGEDTID